MRRREVMAWLVVGGLAAVLASLWIRVPGYMDADYYFSGGARLAQGHGLTEMLLWNYLDDPQGLPHPSHAYWMPLPSILAAAGMWLSGQATFAWARLPFLLLAACLPLLTAWLGLALSGERRLSLLAGVFALFSGYYLPYLLTTESFGLYMLFGSLVIWLSFPADTSWASKLPNALRFLLLGMLAGGMHLSRADGLLWLLAVLALAAWEVYRRRKATGLLLTALDMFLGILFGYFLVTGGWYGRNLLEFGSPLPPGGSKTLWLESYSQTFAYPASGLTFSAWIQSGLGEILRVRLDALLQNLKTWIGVQSSVILWPFLLAGLWQLRREARVRFAALLWLATLLFMSFVFPFAGARGGFFHSGAAVQPFFWVAGAVGFETLLNRAVQARRWQAARAWKMFAPALVGVLLVLTVGQYGTQVGSSDGQTGWQASWDHYRQVEGVLQQSGTLPDEIVMVNNPAGYYAATGRAAIIIPQGGLQAVIGAASRYQARFLILETRIEPELWDLYNNAPQSEGTEFEYLTGVGTTHLFRIHAPACGE